MNSRSCVLCRSRKLKEIFNVEDVPIYSQKVLSKDELELGHSRKTILLFQCQDCDMVQIDVNALSHKDYFDDYVTPRSFTELYKSFENRLASTFVNRFKLSSRDIVEVGCGDGYFAERLTKEGANVTAIEPSKIACRFARERGINCHNVYLDDAIEEHVKEKFDAFVSKQVLDIMKEPNRFLQNLGRILKVGAYGVIDVTSLTKTIFKRRYYDILPDRVSYFTVLTFAKLLERNNFHVIDIFHGVDDEYLVAYMCYEGQRGIMLRDFHDGFQGFERQYIELIKKLSVGNKTIAAWGAGAKGAMLFSACGANPLSIQYVIDKDMHKWERYLPGSLLKIVPPDILDKEKHPDSIIVTGVMYYKEIVKELISKYKYKGNIALLSPEPHIISEDEVREIMEVKYD